VLVEVKLEGEDKWVIGSSKNNLPHHCFNVIQIKSYGA